MTDDHPSNIVSHNWGMDAAIVPGATTRPRPAPGEIIDLVGDRLTCWPSPESCLVPTLTPCGPPWQLAKNPCGRSRARPSPVAGSSS